MKPLEDDVVLVTDSSTNGTLMTKPGGQPVRLDKNRATVVPDGTRLGLADDLFVTISVRRST